MENNSVIFKINQLGAIKNSQFELKPFMIFTGESGLGKSYSAFLVHYLYLLCNSMRIERFFVENDYNFDRLISQTNNDIILKFKCSSLLKWINSDAINYLRYILGNEELEGNIKILIKSFCDEDLLVFKGKKETINVDNKKLIYTNLSLNDSFDIRIPYDSSKWNFYPFIAITQLYLEKKIWSKKTPVSKTFLLPPSRGALVGVTSMTQNTISHNAGMYEEFLMNLDELYKPSKEIILEKNSDNVLNLLRNINKGEIKTEGNKLFYIADNNRMPLSSAAASIKELTPLSLLINKFPIKKYSIMFEEPESHLHPAMQMKVAELVGAMVNEGAHFQITTHSDYFIRRINDLINLHILKDNLPLEEFDSFSQDTGFDHDITLDSKLVGAYVLQKNRNGTVSIKEQDVLKGIPYDSFQKVINEDVLKSLKLSEKVNDVINL